MEIDRKEHILIMSYNEVRRTWMWKKKESVKSKLTPKLHDSWQMLGLSTQKQKGRNGEGL